MFFTIAFAISFAGMVPVVVLGGMQGAVAATDPRFLLMTLAFRSPLVAK